MIQTKQSSRNNRKFFFSRKKNYQNNRPQQPARAFGKFNPSDFIKKAEETVASAAYTNQHTFADFGVDAQLFKNIERKGYHTPTPIQDQTIPHLLQGRDVVGTANTGTGKTAAFLIPLIHHVITKKTKRVLIVAPTRELAAQIYTELSTFKDRMPIGAALCIGGVSINNQIDNLRRAPLFVIGTPGRLKDLEQQRALNFSSFTSIVLDEVDTMLDMGFINDMKYIIQRLPQQRHSLFFSATLSKQIKEVMDQFLTDPISISVKTRQSAANVNQDVVKIAGKNKVDVLHDLLIKPEFTKAIIFVRTKRATDRLSRQLDERGFKIAAIHGDKSQAQRRHALAQFKNNQTKVLLATDVVARGIDIDDVSHVINFDMPQSYEDYIHRIGRTGRANKIGQALTFIE